MKPLFTYCHDMNAVECNRIMNVLQICNGYSGDAFYYELFTRISGGNCKQTIIAPTFRDTKIKEREQPFDVKIFWRENNILSRLQFSRKIKSITSFTKECDCSKFDIIHAHTLFSDGFVAYNISREYDIPYIVAVRDTDLNFFYKYYCHLRSKAHSVLLGASRVVVISSAYRSKLAMLLPDDVYGKIKDKIVSIPNGMNDTWLKRIHHHTIIDELKEVRLVSCGQVIRRKNFHSTIEAVNKLYCQGVSLRLTIIGKKKGQCDRYLKKVESMIRKSPIDIVLRERMGIEELIECYRENDIFVLPSFTETFGIVYPEALSQGLPVVYTSGEGFDGQYEDGEIGKSASPNSVDSIASAIRYVIDNYGAVSTNVSNIDFSRYDWNTISGMYQCIYLKYGKKRK